MASQLTEDHRTSPSRPGAARRHFSLMSILVAIGLVAVVCGGIGYCIQVAQQRTAERRLKDTRVAFRHVGESLILYDLYYDRLPFSVRRETIGMQTRRGIVNGKGKPLYSWRAEVAELADSWWCEGPWDPSQPWNSPANRTMAAFPWRYSYDAIGLDDGGRLPRNFSPSTNMLAITGSGTAFGAEDETPKSLADLNPDTILVVEVANSGIHWMQPGDFDLRTMPRTICAKNGAGISSRYPGGFHVLFADGQVWFVSRKVPFESLEKFFTVDGAKEFDRNEVLRPYLLHREPSMARPLAANFSPDATWVSINDPEVTDTDLESLQGLTNITHLSLGHTKITGPGLIHLKGFSHLKVLSLDRTAITDASLKYIEGLTGLETLQLAENAIGDAGLQQISHLTNLQWLVLSGTQVTDAGLVELRGLTKLNHLFLNATEITDAGLAHLGHLPNLRRLHVYKTQVTEQGVERFREAVPDCVVHSEYELRALR